MRYTRSRRLPRPARDLSSEEAAEGGDVAPVNGRRDSVRHRSFGARVQVRDECRRVEVSRRPACTPSNRSPSARVGGAPASDAPQGVGAGLAMGCGRTQRHRIDRPAARQPKRDARAISRRGASAAERRVGRSARGLYVLAAPPVFAKASSSDFDGQRRSRRPQTARCRFAAEPSWVGPTIVETKTARSRRLVVIGNVATEALRRHRASQAERRLRRAEACEHHDLVFPNTFGKPINPPNLLARSFRPLLERAGLPRMRFHDLRHTAATLCCSTRRTSEDRLRNAGALDDRDHPRLVLARQPYDARTGGAGAGFAVWLSTWLSNEYPVTR